MSTCAPFNMETTKQLADKWLAQDQDHDTRREIEDLVITNDVTGLESRLRHRIAFGTAGLRASMQAGFSHMNSLIVLQASHGLARYIIEQNAPKFSVVIGHDARHNSHRFAKLAAAAFLSHGFEVLWFDQLVHTPMIPSTLKHWKAAAGVMVTASHNPKNDNGYKVYWDNGCQIIPPHDRGIAKAIDAIGEVATWDPDIVRTHPKVKHVTTDSINAYFESLGQLVLPIPETSQPLRFAYTPMHGVGLPFMQRAASMYGTSVSMQVVTSQAEPDPDFPTVPFPNPEEKGALTPAVRDAESSGCFLILASDPDADRFAAVQRLDNGSWHQFTGNQMGVLLASHMLDAYPGNKSRLAMLASTVSSRMLASMAKKEGFHFQETLTGFKWLGNVARDLQRQGYEPVYAYEEAIGYMFSDVVWDKDGIAAATVFLKACLSWQQQGQTPYSKLQDLYERYGHFEDANTYLISPSPDTTNAVFQDIRKINNGTRPETVGKRTIFRWRDLTLGYDSSAADNRPDLPIDASAQMITCEMNDVVFTARGSGTEPKIKLYIEAQADDAKTARDAADEVLQDLVREWFKPEWGLRLAGS